jgi:hypothetical protein
MTVRVKEDRGTVTLTKGALKVSMSVAEFEHRICKMTDWYSMKKGHEDYDKYHGVAAKMFDPSAPFPQTFNSRVSVRWKPSGAVNGPIITPATALQHYMRRSRG